MLTASRDLDKVMVRMPEGMRDHIKGMAQSERRSANAQIVWMLQRQIDAATGVKFGDQAPAAALNEQPGTAAHSTHAS